MSRNDERDDEAQQAKEHLFQGLGHLFRAAQAAATGIRKELDKSSVGKSIDDAGRELFRAANNVVSRLGNEILFSPKDKDKDEEPKPDEKETPREDQDPPRWAPGKKPKGPTEEDPGFHIAGDDDDTPR